MPIWADGPPGVVGNAVGVTNFFSPRLSSSNPAGDSAGVIDGRFTVRAGSWGMEIRLRHGYSRGREEELENDPGVRELGVDLTGAEVRVLPG